MTETIWTDVGALDQVPRLGARVVRTPQGCVALFRTVDDRAFALEDRCPHKGGPLSQGIVHGANVTCPLHNWVLSLETGEAQGADAGRAATFPLKVEAGRILVDLSALAGQPVLGKAS
ncbi:assimilatory nitrite reductase (NAD(P)H) small subunit [Roseiarcus fermentans]|uniref:Assimilatory nitrite reductase (NAD(P)H) small subunit n=1 Tax=Roseiarcus fermentans TaxID=1473586 RepID=A0A366EEW4_9HYPH|nr:nitrite reductase small subunit NirD [Roseiarcus fermentans]RBP00954.1 assimilatory nitrite reductase (NAD(P)H) small subunit [Roseiarcus fermentans]